MRTLRHVLWLGAHELRSLSRDPVLLLFVLYAFTAYVATAGGGLSLDVESAPIGVVDRDRSPLSRRIVRGLRPPEFRPPVSVVPGGVDAALRSGAQTFVLFVPEGFERAVRAGLRPALQLHVDATAVSQAFVGAGYVEAVVGRAVAETLGRAGRPPPPIPEARLRIRFNPNGTSSWHVSVVELLFVVTLLSLVLPAASLLRERERGTLEHLLTLPLRPLELMLGKLWAHALLVLGGTLLSLALVVRGLFGAPFHGSLPLFVAGTLLYQFAVAGLGMTLATFARTVPQVALLSVLVVSPLLFLSGAWTPIESLPQALRWLTYASPLRYYADFCFGVAFRGAGASLLAPELAALAALATGLFAIGALRFRSRFAAAG